MDEQSLFLQALEKSSGHERVAWLQKTCGSDAALRERIETLLREHDQASGFLEKPALGLDPTVVPESSVERAASMDAGLATAFSRRLPSCWAMPITAC